MIKSILLNVSSLADSVCLWDTKLKVFCVAVKVVAGELEEDVGHVVPKTDALMTAFSFLADDHHLDGLFTQLDDRAWRQTAATVGEDGHPVLEILSRRVLRRARDEDRKPLQHHCRSSAGQPVCQGARRGGRRGDGPSSLICSRLHSSCMAVWTLHSRWKQTALMRLKFLAWTCRTSAFVGLLNEESGPRFTKPLGLRARLGDESGSLISVPCVRASVCLSVERLIVFGPKSKTQNQHIKKMIRFNTSESTHQNQHIKKMIRSKTQEENEEEREGMSANRNPNPLFRIPQREKVKATLQVKKMIRRKMRRMRREEKVLRPCHPFQSWRHRCQSHCARNEARRIRPRGPKRCFPCGECQTLTRERPLRQRQDERV